MGETQGYLGLWDECHRLLQALVEVERAARAFQASVERPESPEAEAEEAGACEGRFKQAILQLKALLSEKVFTPLDPEWGHYDVGNMRILDPFNHFLIELHEELDEVLFNVEVGRSRKAVQFILKSMALSCESLKEDVIREIEDDRATRRALLRRNPDQQLVEDLREERSLESDREHQPQSGGDCGSDSRATTGSPPSVVGTGPHRKEQGKADLNGDCTEGTGIPLAEPKQTTSDLTAGKIPPEERTCPMSFKEAARYMGKGGDKKGAAWVSRRVKKGTLKCESFSRQQHVFSREDFSKEVWPKILPM